MKVLKDAAMPAPPGLPPFAPVSIELLDLLSREETVAAQVAELLRMDPEFVAEVLRPGKALRFGFEREIRTLAHAVVCLGPRRIEALVAAASLRQPVAARAPMRGYWRHDVASGFLAAGFAAARGIGPNQGSLLDMLRESAASSAPAAASHCAMPAEIAAAQVLADVLGQVVCCAAEGPARQVACDALRQLPRSTWEAFRFDPAWLVRVIEETAASINN